MLDFYEEGCVRPGAQIMYHPIDGDPFVIEAAEPEVGAMVCEGCVFNAPHAPRCFDIPCAGGNVIYRKVCDA